jgi:hypothetical protein
VRDARVFRSGNGFGYSNGIMNRNPNPQGKGLAPVLDSLTASRTQLSVPPKRVDQISSELFTSLFVLHSEFHFKPVPGKRYCLYRKADGFRLSLITPAEWGDGRFGQYIGECVLQPDLTWTLRFDERAAQDQRLLALIESQRRAFEQRLAAAESLDSALPVFDASLPFFRRVFASALAHSLGLSMRKSGILGLSYRQAQGLLPGPGVRGRDA